MQATTETAQTALKPPHPGEPFQPASEEIRQQAVEFLTALGDTEYEQRGGGVSLATFIGLIICQAEAWASSAVLVVTVATAVARVG